MSASKAERQRYWVVYMLDDLPVGANFTIEALHLTFIPWFVTDRPDDRVVESFQSTFSGIKSLQLRLGEIVELGPRELKVNLVEPRDELKVIHNRALEWFEQIYGRWALKNPYVGADYKPHIRHRVDTKLAPGEVINMSSISLVSANRQEDWQREVVARVDLA